MTRFTLRDLILLTLLVSVSCGWAVDSVGHKHPLTIVSLVVQWLREGLPKELP